MTLQSNKLQFVQLFGLGSIRGAAVPPAGTAEYFPFDVSMSRF